MSNEERDELAGKILVELTAVPTLVISSLAYRLDSEERDIQYVLDSYEVIDGVPVHNGPGQGGSWLPEEHRAQMVPVVATDDEEIGYRWPDGSLRDMPFDIGNAEHRAEFNLPDPPETPQN